MPITVHCPGCGRQYRVRDEFAGETLPCKQCDASFRVPRRQSTFERLYQQPDVRPLRETRPDRAAPPPRRPAARVRDNGGEAAGSNRGLLIGLGVSGGILALLGVAGLLIFLLMRPGDDESDGSPAALAGVEVPAFPELPPGRLLDGSGTRVSFVDLGRQSDNSSGPGKQMKMRVYLPGGDHPPKSLGCVLVAPAGTTLLHGLKLDDDDYHAETMPYVRAGYAVVFYSIDGPLDDWNRASDAQKGEAYKKFKAAQAGVVNGRNALEFVLAKLPQVDPKRIYCAGHSSAATLSLLLAAREKRIAGCIAYAPATDLESRLGDVAGDPSYARLLPGVKDFLRTSSPKSHAGEYECPLFVFHSRDDRNVPFRDSQSFVDLLQRKNRKVTFSNVSRGGHYDSMVNPGIPRGIAWLQNLPAEREARGRDGGSGPPAASPPPTSSPPRQLPTAGGRTRPRLPPATLPGRSRALPTRIRRSRTMPRSMRRVLVLTVRSFRGRGDEGSAARTALSRVRGIEAKDVKYDAASRTITVSLADPRSLGLALRALTQAGFRFSKFQTRSSR